MVLIFMRLIFTRFSIYDKVEHKKLQYFWFFIKLINVTVKLILVTVIYLKKLASAEILLFVSKSIIVLSEFTRYNSAVHSSCNSMLK